MSNENVNKVLSTLAKQLSLPCGDTYLTSSSKRRNSNESEQQSQDMLSEQDYQIFENDLQSMEPHVHSNIIKYDDIPDDDIEEKIEDITVGICAMEKKVQSKPMMEILTRLEGYDYFKIIIFSQETILNEPVEQWPRCDCLISFYSKDFPLLKAQEYVKLCNPFLINNLSKQWDIMNRVRVYETLQKAGIEQPRYAIKYESDNERAIEQDDQIEINGQVFTKPFVEKPVNADDHNVFIYFPTSAGGGSQRLFRKVGSRSSHYSTENRIRQNGSFIYEEFMPTDGTDVKVYTVGPEYAHAEARKSPALDGVVERDENGKEVRYPIMLSANEKLIAKKIVLAFEQSVCGFDLLRANGKSYVCDVNGFSFVKNSIKYYDDCASILAYMIIKEIAPQRHIPISISYEAETRPIVPTSYGTLMELRCIIAVIRHGDRTPKQKLKMEVKHSLFFDLFEKYDGFKTGELKLKRPSQLQEVLDVARTLLRKCADENVETLETKETRTKLIQIKSVLEMYGHFSGINRKVQFKYQKSGKKKTKKLPHTSSEDDLSREEEVQRDPSLLLILKWGGELTAHGRAQAEDLGNAFRKLYPSGEGNYTTGNDKSDTGFLRLHSTYRHDLKIYASDEGRVQMTAASFAKGLMALEGELAPILVQMVKSANTNGLLDNDSLSASYQNEVKQKLVTYLSENKDLKREDFDRLAPTQNYSLKSALEFIKNPKEMCFKVYNYIRELTDCIRNKITKSKYYEKELYHSETWELMLRRWSKLEKDFFNKKTQQFEISKIPDIYDCIKYDLMHNQRILQFDHGFELYMCSKALADYVIPQEYGISKEEKLRIAQGIVAPLIQKIRIDLKSNLTGIWDCEDELVNKLNPSYSKGIQTPGRHVRTRLYFTSESHVYSLLNVLKYGDLFGVNNDDPQWRAAMESLSAIPELNYLTQIIIMLFEDTSVDAKSDKRFHIELHFSPGAYDCIEEPDKIASKQHKESTNNSSPRSIKIPIKTSTLLPDHPHTPNKQKHTTLSNLKRFFKSDLETNTIPENSMPVEINNVSGNSARVTSASTAHAHGNNDATKPRSFEEDSYKNRVDIKKGMKTLNAESYYPYNTFHGSGTLNTYTPVSHIFNNGTNSSPDLNKVMQEKKNARKVEREALYPELIKVRSIVPLQTIHNNLCFKNLNEFLARMANDKQQLQQDENLSTKEN